MLETSMQKFGRCRTARLVSRRPNFRLERSTHQLQRKPPPTHSCIYLLLFKYASLTDQLSCFSPPRSETWQLATGDVFFRLFQPRCNVVISVPRPSSRHVAFFLAFPFPFRHRGVRQSGQIHSAHEDPWLKICLQLEEHGKDE